MTKPKALKNAIANFNASMKPFEQSKLTQTWLPKEEKDKAHAQRCVSLMTLMAESNKAKMESGEACI